MSKQAAILYLDVQGIVRHAVQIQTCNLNMESSHDLLLANKLMNHTGPIRKQFLGLAS